MNKEILNELKERALKATKGPWMTWPTTACNGEYTGLDVMTHDGGALITEETHPSDEDALFIAAANPAAVLELIALAERATAAESRLAEIQRGMEGAEGYWRNAPHYDEVGSSEPQKEFFLADDIRALLQPQGQADTSGLPGGKDIT